MKAASVLNLIISLSVVAESKVYTRCKLAKIFVKAGLDNYGGFSLGNWICMAYYESHYNTTVQKVLEDGSTDYGIFQINSFTWCRNVRLQQKNHCHVACSALITDDLTDAILCAKKIVKETQGMNYCPEGLPITVTTVAGIRATFHCPKGRQLVTVVAVDMVA
ncbi:Lysozyme-like protein 1 [Microtus ochrogaster]|uniref:Lysozyme-like protein 1 n=1 Tax=Microtus ochrogaster TaxID=79684 RepID=A0A8J6FZ95_MICOH|nr:Lysozyme-like protein 1 [Microtus ochrogaster]